MTDAEIAQVGQALAHPLRVALLREMRRRSPQPLSAVQYSRASDEPLGNVSYHLMKLRALGVAEVVDTAQRRGAIEHMHALGGPNAAGLQRLLDLLA